MEWIDTHSHLNDRSFDGRIEEVLDRALVAGLAKILVVGTDLSDSIRAIELADQHESLVAAVGLQPNNLNECAETDWREIETLASLPQVVAIGETGLDNYWKTVATDLQREYFRRHLELSRRLRKPVVIHCRDAEADVLEVLTDDAHRHGKIEGVMHSYTGDAASAVRCLELGLYVSFAGMVTFKKSDALRAVAKTIPLDRLLIETDSPYLSPEPFRGKPNEPCRVVHTGECLAQVLGMDATEIAEATTRNAQSLFKMH